MPDRRVPIKRAVSTGLLLLVALACFLSLHRVKTKAFQIVADTLPGLSDAGMANSDVSDDFNHILMALMAPTASEKEGLLRQSDILEMEAAKNLKSYENSLFENEDRMNFKQLMEFRQAYLEARGKVIELINHGANQEAIVQYKKSLLPCYDHYMSAGKAVLDYNTNEGRARGRSIMRLSNLTQYAVAAFTVVLFILGFFVGIFRYNPAPKKPLPAAVKSV